MTCVDSDTDVATGILLGVRRAMQIEHIYVSRRIDSMCTGMSIDMCMNMDAAMCADRHIDLCIDMYVNMCKDMCKDMCIDMYMNMQMNIIDMRKDMSIV